MRTDLHATLPAAPLKTIADDQMSWPPRSIVHNLESGKREEMMTSAGADWRDQPFTAISIFFFAPSRGNIFDRERCC
jgi:hypothetical protein